MARQLSNRPRRDRRWSAAEQRQVVAAAEASARARRRRRPEPRAPDFSMVLHLPGERDDFGHARPSKLQERWAKATFETSHGGLRSVVTSMQVSGRRKSGITLSGSVLDGAGNKAGYWSRTVTPRIREVRHNALFLRGGAQGAGFARAFNARAEAGYRAAGIKTIALHATSDIGGYAWAKQGFMWDRGTAEQWASDLAAIRGRTYDSFDEHGETVPHEGELYQSPLDFDALINGAYGERAGNEALRRLPRTVDASPMFTEEVYQDMGRLAQKGDRLTPLEVAGLGRGKAEVTFEGRTYWAGKAMLLGSDWQGKRRVGEGRFGKARPVWEDLARYQPKPGDGQDYTEHWPDLEDTSADPWPSPTGQLPWGDDVAKGRRRPRRDRLWTPAEQRQVEAAARASARARQRDEPQPGGRAPNFAAVLLRPPGPAGRLSPLQRRWAEMTWQGTHNGLRSVVEDARFDGRGTLGATGYILDAKGKDVGRFIRATGVDTAKGRGRPTLTAHHISLTLEPGAQGAGFARAFNAQAEAGYRAAGIRHVQLYATSGVGGYAWAKQGYVWDRREAQSWSDELGRISQRLDAGPLDRDEMRAVLQGGPYRPQGDGNHDVNALATGGDPSGLFNDAVHKDLRRAARKGDRLTPLEVAGIGRGKGDVTYEGRSYWLGKAMLLGSAWNGHKELRGRGLRKARPVWQDLARYQPRPSDGQDYTEHWPDVEDRPTDPWPSPTGQLPWGDEGDVAKARGARPRRPLSPAEREQRRQAGLASARKRGREQNLRWVADLLRREPDEGRRRVELRRASEDLKLGIADTQRLWLDAFHDGRPLRLGDGEPAQGLAPIDRERTRPLPDEAPPRRRRRGVGKAKPRLRRDPGFEAEHPRGPDGRFRDKAGAMPGAGGVHASRAAPPETRWYHGSGRRGDLELGATPVHRRTPDLSGYLGLHVTPDRRTAERIADGGTVSAVGARLRNPKVYGGKGKVPGGVMSLGEAELQFDLFRYGFRTGLISERTLFDDPEPRRHGTDLSPELLDGYTWDGKDDGVPLRPGMQARPLSGWERTTYDVDAVGDDGTVRISRLYDSLSSRDHERWGRIRDAVALGADPVEAVGAEYLDRWNYQGDTPVSAAARVIYGWNKRPLRYQAGQGPGAEERLKRRVAFGFREELKAQGHDGILYWNRIETPDWGGGGENWSAVLFPGTGRLRKARRRPKRDRLWTPAEQRQVEAAARASAAARRRITQAPARPLRSVTADELWAARRQQQAGPRGMHPGLLAREDRTHDRTEGRRALVPGLPEGDQLRTLRELSTVHDALESWKHWEGAVGMRRAADRLLRRPTSEELGPVLRRGESPHYRPDRQDLHAFQARALLRAVFDPTTDSYVVNSTEGRDRMLAGRSVTSQYRGTALDPDQRDAFEGRFAVGRTFDLSLAAVSPSRVVALEYAPQRSEPYVPVLFRVQPGGKIITDNEVPAYEGVTSGRFRVAEVAELAPLGPRELPGYEVTVTHEAVFEPDAGRGRKLPRHYIEKARPAPPSPFEALERPWGALFKARRRPKRDRLWTPAEQRQVEAAARASARARRKPMAAPARPLRPVTLDELSRLAGPGARRGAEAIGAPGQALATARRLGSAQTRLIRVTEGRPLLSLSELTSLRASQETWRYWPGAVGMRRAADRLLRHPTSDELARAMGREESNFFRAEDADRHAWHARNVLRAIYLPETDTLGLGPHEGAGWEEVAGHSGRSQVELYRGAALRPGQRDAFEERFAPGSTFDVGLAATSPMRGQAEVFAVHAHDFPEGGQVPVLFRFEAGTKALFDDIDPSLEAVTSGRFRVLDVARGPVTFDSKDDGYLVTVGHEAVFEPDAGRGRKLPRHYRFPDRHPDRIEKERPMRFEPLEPEWDALFDPPRPTLAKAARRRGTRRDDDHWEDQERWPPGHPRGGQFRSGGGGRNWRRELRNLGLVVGGAAVLYNIAGRPRPGGIDSAYATVSYNRRRRQPHGRGHGFAKARPRKRRLSAAEYRQRRQNAARQARPNSPLEGAPAERPKWPEVGRGAGKGRQGDLFELSLDSDEPAEGQLFAPERRKAGTERLVQGSLFGEDVAPRRKKSGSRCPACGAESKGLCASCRRRGTDAPTLFKARRPGRHGGLTGAFADITSEEAGTGGGGGRHRGSARGQPRYPKGHPKGGQFRPRDTLFAAGIGRTVGRAAHRGRGRGGRGGGGARYDLVERNQAQRVRAAQERARRSGRDPVEEYRELGRPRPRLSPAQQEAKVAEAFRRARRSGRDPVEELKDLGEGPLPTRPARPQRFFGALGRAASRVPIAPRVARAGAGVANATAVRPVRAVLATSTGRQLAGALAAGALAAGTRELAARHGRSDKPKWTPEEGEQRLVVTGRPDTLAAGGEVRTANDEENRPTVWSQEGVGQLQTNERGDFFFTPAFGTGAAVRGAASRVYAKTPWGRRAEQRRREEERQAQERAVEDARLRRLQGVGEPDVDPETGRPNLSIVPPPETARPARPKAPETAPETAREAGEAQPPLARPANPMGGAWSSRAAAAEQRRAEGERAREAARARDIPEIDAYREEARRRLPEVHAEIKAEAKNYAYDLEGQLDQWGALELDPPPPKTVRHVDPVTGRVSRRRPGGGEWDWFDQLSSREQRYLRDNWMGKAPSGMSGPDNVSDAMNRAMGTDQGIDANMGRWLQAVRDYDGAMRLAAGKGRTWGGFDPNVYAPQAAEKYGDLDAAMPLNYPKGGAKRPKGAPKAGRGAGQRQRQEAERKARTEEAVEYLASLWRGQDERDFEELWEREFGLNKARPARPARPAVIAKHPGHPDQSVHGRRGSRRPGRRPVGLRTGGRGTIQQWVDTGGRYTRDPRKKRPRPGQEAAEGALARAVAAPFRAADRVQGVGGRLRRSDYARGALFGLGAAGVLTVGAKRPRPPSAPPEGGAKPLRPVEPTGPPQPRAASAAPERRTGRERRKRPAAQRRASG